MEALREEPLVHGHVVRALKVEGRVVLLDDLARDVDVVHLVRRREKVTDGERRREEAREDERRRGKVRDGESAAPPSPSMSPNFTLATELPLPTEILIVLAPPLIWCV